MSDVFTKAKRSEVMRAIHSRGNKDTELRLAAIFRAHKITGWRRQMRLKFQSKEGAAYVRADFVFRREGLAVFVDGCFWHGCPRHYTRPKGNQKFWDAKVLRNRARDRTVNRGLRIEGWRVLRLWEHDLSSKQEARLVRRLRRWIGAKPDKAL